MTVSSPTQGGSSPTGSPALVLFDGVCNFCNRWVRFVIRRDRAQRFRFASLQSELGRSVLERHGLTSVDDAAGGSKALDTIVLVEDHGGSDERVLVRSDAVLTIARGLRAPWSWGGLALIVPRFLRDGVYALVAASRYRLFGKSETCPLPTAEERSRFVG